MKRYYFDCLEFSAKLLKTLEELKKVGLLIDYEILESRKQVSYVPLSDSTHFTLGVILGQFDAIRSNPIGSFVKARKNSA